MVGGWSESSYRVTPTWVEVGLSCVEVELEVGLGCHKNLQGIITRQGYNATKKALRGHAAICELQQCCICTINEKAKNYKYCPTNIYNTSLIENDISTKPLHRTKKAVSFAKDTTFKFQANSAFINYAKIHKSMAACCSLVETNMLQ